MAHVTPGRRRRQHRLLLGDLDVNCDLINADRLVHPPDGQKWQGDVRLSVRGIWSSAMTGCSWAKLARC